MQDRSTAGSISPVATASAGATAATITTAANLGSKIAEETATVSSPMHGSASSLGSISPAASAGATAAAISPATSSTLSPALSSVDSSDKGEIFSSQDKHLVLPNKAHPRSVRAIETKKGASKFQRTRVSFMRC